LPALTAQPSIFWKLWQNFPVNKHFALVVSWTSSGDQCTMIRNKLQSVQQTTKPYAKHVLGLSSKQTSKKMLQTTAD